MEAAKRIPSGRYVAYIGLSLSLPFEGHPTNPSSIALVCRGIPPQFTYRDETPASIPTLPNSQCNGGRQPMIPTGSDCYVSTFTARTCRVINAERDYSPVLCVLDDKLNGRANTWIAMDKQAMINFERRRKLGDRDALARKPLPPTPAELSTDPLSFLPPLPSTPTEHASPTTDA